MTVSVHITLMVYERQILITKSVYDVIYQDFEKKKDIVFKSLDVYNLSTERGLFMFLFL